MRSPTFNTLHQFLTFARFECRTVPEAKHLASVLASLCPKPDTQRAGLVELLVNAVEHGNLEVDHQTKAELMRSGGWIAELERRGALPEYAQRRVSVSFERTAVEVVITIKDEGAGFDFRAYSGRKNAEAASEDGRGIAVAQRMSFDSVEYRGTGSEVCARAPRSRFRERETRLRTGTHHVPGQRALALTSKPQAVGGASCRR